MSQDVHDEEKLKDLEMAVKRAEEKLDMEDARNAARKKRVEFEDSKGRSSSGAQESKFLHKFKLRRGLLGFLGGKGHSETVSKDDSVEKLLKMCQEEKEGSKSSSLTNSPKSNTIEIQHTSKDRRFWKLKGRRNS